MAVIGLVIIGGEIQKKKMSWTESSVEVSQCTLPTDVSMEKMIDTASIKIGDTVRIKIGKSKTKTGIVSAVSKKGTVKLHKYGRFSAVVRVIQRNTTNGNNREGDSEKKIRSRTESAAKEHHNSLLRNDTFTKYCVLRSIRMQPQ